MTNVVKTLHHDTYAAINPALPHLSQAGNTIMITGAGTGVGAGITRSFAAATASRIILLGRRLHLLEKRVAELQPEFPNTEFVARRCDISDLEQVNQLWKELAEREVRVDVLVLNAAHVNRLGPTLRTGFDDVMKAFDTNLKGNWAMTETYLNLEEKGGEKKNKKKVLINVSTAAIHMHLLPGQTPYGASKTAFNSLLERIATEVSVDDIQIINMHPGAIKSEGPISAGYDDALLKKIVWEPVELPADFAVWAASPDAAFLHGRFVWAHWDVDELKQGDGELMRRLREDESFLKLGVGGVENIDMGYFY